MTHKGSIPAMTPEETIRQYELAVTDLYGWLRIAILTQPATPDVLRELTRDLIGGIVIARRDVDASTEISRLRALAGEAAAFPPDVRDGPPPLWAIDAGQRFWMCFIAAMSDCEGSGEYWVHCEAARSYTGEDHRRVVGAHFNWEEDLHEGEECPILECYPCGEDPPVPVGWPPKPGTMATLPWPPET